jgi:hypothetical protein
MEPKDSGQHPMEIVLFLGISQINPSLVAKHYNVPFDYFHVETTSNSLTMPLEENWRDLLRLSKLKTIQHKYGMPTRLASTEERGYSSLVKIYPDNLSYKRIHFQTNKLAQLTTDLLVAIR